MAVGVEEEELPGPVRAAFAGVVGEALALEKRLSLIDGGYLQGEVRVSFTAIHGGCSPGNQMLKDIF